MCVSVQRPNLISKENNRQCAPVFFFFFYFIFRIGSLTDEHRQWIISQINVYVAQESESE